MESLQILIGGVLATVLPPLLLTLVVLPFVAVWRWRGAWRLLALMPMARPRLHGHAFFYRHRARSDRAQSLAVDLDAVGRGELRLPSCSG